MSRFPDDWIPREVRMPTEEDADQFHCVMVWHVFQGLMVTGWFNVADNRFISHWARTAEPPRFVDPGYKDL